MVNEGRDPSPDAMSIWINRIGPCLMDLGAVDNTGSNEKVTGNSSESMI